MTVELRNHGGKCCGSRHIFTFRNEINPQGDITELRQHVRNSDNSLRLEVILSDLQTRNKPNLIRALKNLGFVYVESWTGNHGTPVHLFSRCGSRLRAMETRFFRDRWTGQTLNPALGGSLPTITTAHPLVAGLQAHTERGEETNPPRPTTVHTTYHNRYRRTGRIGAGFETLELAEQNAPRCQTRLRREIMSDGTVNDTEI